MQAIILCGGNGRRLAPYTDEIPKGMVRVGGKPILKYQVDWLKKHGINEIKFACGWRWEIIRDYFGDDYSYSTESSPLGRGGSLKKAWDSTARLSSPKSGSPTEPIVVLNGDILTNLDLREVIDFHHAKSGRLVRQAHQPAHQPVTLCLFKYRSPYGVVHLGKENQILFFKEKELLNEWVSGGIYIFDKGVRELLPEVGDHEQVLFPNLAREGSLFGFKSSAYWRPIDTVKDLEEAEDEILHVQF